ncbi:MAG: T9SS type A sorting domain-containing protein [Bacteroidales bacterium]|jgi:hypothetical protein|nr:T9SS type A sorting domain-containing protein [Bacteroidales bacterium]
MKIKAFTIEKTKMFNYVFVFIIAILFCIPNAFSQLEINAETPTGGLEIGSHDGIFKYTAVNNTDTVITITSVDFNNFRGVSILQSPAAEYSINGNTSNTYLSDNVFNTPVTLNPGDTLAFSFTAAAGCESIFELGENVQNEITYNFNNGQVQTESTDSYAIKWPRIVIPTNTAVLTTETEYDLIIPISNTVGAGDIEQIEFSIILPEGVRPKDENRNLVVSTDEQTWALTNIWPQSGYDTLKYLITIADLTNFGFAPLLNDGQTLYLKFQLENLSVNIPSVNVKYFANFNESYNIFCDQYTLSNTEIIRSTGTPNLTMQIAILDSISVCDDNGIVSITIQNNGDGIAHLNSLNIPFYSTEITAIRVNGINYPQLESNLLTFLDYNFDGEGGLENLNGDNLFDELSPGDEIVIELEYVKDESSILNFQGNLQLLPVVSYTSLDNRVFSTEVKLQDTNQRLSFSLTGPSFLNADNITEYTYTVVSGFFTRREIIGEREYFVRLTAPEGFSINGGTNVAELPATSLTNDHVGYNNMFVIVVDSSLKCVRAPLICELGYHQPERCSPEDFYLITPVQTKTVFVIDEEQELTDTVDNIVNLSSSIERLSFGYDLNDIANVIPYQSEITSLPLYTNSPNENLVTSGDHINYILNGALLTVPGSTVNEIQVYLDVSRANLFTYISGELEIGGDTYQLSSPQVTGTLMEFTVDVSQNSLSGTQNLQVTVELNSNSGAVLSEEFISGEFQMLNSSNQLYGSCPLVAPFTFVMKTLSVYNSDATVCPFNYTTFNGFSTNTAYFPNEYKTNEFVESVIIRKISGIELKQEDFEVVLLPRNEVLPITLEETEADYILHFTEPILIDFVNYQIRTIISPKKLCLENIITNSQVQYRLVDLSGTERLSAVYNRGAILPVVQIEQPPVGNTISKNIVWEVTVNEMGGAASPINYMQWIPQNKIQLDKIFIDSEEVETENHNDTLFFQYSLEKNQTRNFRFEATILTCEPNVEITSHIRNAILCEEIDFDEFETYVSPCYDRNLNILNGDLSLIPTTTENTTQYVNLCDTLPYKVTISQYNADSTGISFWFDSIPNNVNIINDQISYSLSNANGTSTISGGILEQPHNNYVSTDIIQAHNVDDWREPLTEINFNVQISCDENNPITDITAPFGVNVSRVNLCGDTTEVEHFTFRPNIKGFERLDSIKVSATAEGYDENGIGTISVKTVNLYPSLVDSVYITAILPNGVQYVPGSTVENLFDTIIVEGSKVIWAFKKGEHIKGSDSLYYTFNVINNSVCDIDSQTIVIESSLEREVLSCKNDGSYCLVKATSDTAKVVLYGSEIKLITDINTVDELCSGDEGVFEIIIADSANLQLDYDSNEVFISNGTIRAISNFTGTASIQVSVYNDANCSEDTTIFVIVKPKETVTIEPVAKLNLDDEPEPFALVATPEGGTWSSDYVVDGIFDPAAAGVGIHTVIYTYQPEGYCVSSDTIEIEVLSCLPRIYLKDRVICNYDTYVNAFYIPIFITPVYECPDCEEILNISFDFEYSQSGVKYYSGGCDGGLSGVFFNAKIEDTFGGIRESPRTVNIQLYGEELNAFVNEGGHMYNLLFIPEDSTAASYSMDITIKNAYVNGRLISETLEESSANYLFLHSPSIDLPDTSFCQGNSVTISPTVTGTGWDAPFAYDWNRTLVFDGTRWVYTSAGIHTDSITVSSAGTNTVLVGNQYGCTYLAEAIVTENSLPEVILQDTSFCSGENVQLQAVVSGNAPYEYLWNTTETTNNITVDSDGQYVVQVTDANNCVAEDSNTVVQHEAPTIQTIDAEFCSGGTVTLSPVLTGNSPFSFLWNTNETTSSIAVGSGGNYTIEVSDMNDCVASDTITVTENSLPQITVDDITTCSGETETITANVTGNPPFTYEWNTLETTSEIDVTNAGTYTVTTMDVNNCEANDSAIVTVIQAPVIPQIDAPQFVIANNVYDASVTNQEADVTYNWIGVSLVSGEGTGDIQFSTDMLPSSICVTATRDICESEETCTLLEELQLVEISGDAIICKQNINDSWHNGQYSIVSPNQNSTYVWSISNETLASFSTGNQGESVGISFAAGLGTVILTVEEYESGSLVSVGTFTVNLNERPNSTNITLAGVQGYPGVCANDSNVLYSIEPEGEYLWTIVGADTSIVSGSTNEALISFGTQQVNIEIRAQNGEGCASWQPFTTWIATGSTTTCFDNPNPAALKSFAINMDNEDAEIIIPTTEVVSNIIIIHPQPADDILYIDSDLPILSVTVYSNNSSLINVFKNVSQIDVSDLPSGIYYLHIETKDGIEVRPVLIQR